MKGPLINPKLHLLELKGPAHFVTYCSYIQNGERILWLARQDRKGLLYRLNQAKLPLWQLQAYNWWTGALFALGSLIFLVGAILSVVPNPLSAFQIAVLFFIGSIPFTTAAFLQNLQAANAGDYLPNDNAQPRRVHIIGWRPNSLGWLSTFSQLLGTIAFDINTFNGIYPSSSWYKQDIAIWVPDVVGSALFLISAYLAFIEESHAFWSWKPRSLDWQIVFINLWGCIFFMTAGITAFVPSHALPEWIGTLSNVHLGLGALCFLIAALFSMRESRVVIPASSSVSSSAKAEGAAT